MMTEGTDNRNGLGLRERGKRERLRRIKEAALSAFKTQGYDAASTREIARMADVSIGTLFVYAQDKRDLLFLVLNEDLDEIYEHAVADVPRDGSVVDRLVALLRPVYAYFAAEPELARASLREMGHFDPRNPAAGKQAQRYYDRLDRWRAAIAALLADAGKRGRLRIRDEQYELLARALLDVHLGAVRVWLQQNAPELGSGLVALKSLFCVIIGDRKG
jgi:AcrR family transcriptional regulator